MVCKLILFNYRLLFYVFDNLSKDDLTSIPNLLHNLKGKRHSKQRMLHTHIHIHTHTHTHTHTHYITHRHMIRKTLKSKHHQVIFPGLYFTNMTKL